MWVWCSILVRVTNVGLVEYFSKSYKCGFDGVF